MRLEIKKIFNLKTTLQWVNGILQKKTFKEIIIIVNSFELLSESLFSMSDIVN